MVAVLVEVGAGRVMVDVPTCSVYNHVGREQVLAGLNYGIWLQIGWNCSTAVRVFVASLPRSA